MLDSLNILDMLDMLGSLDGSKSFKEQSRRPLKKESLNNLGGLDLLINSLVDFERLRLRNDLVNLERLGNSLANVERSGCGLKNNFDNFDLLRNRLRVSKGLKNNFDNLEKLGKLSRDINKFHYSVNYRFNYRFNYS